MSKKKRQKKGTGLLFVTSQYKINWLLVIVSIILSVIASTQSGKVPDETSKLFDGSFDLAKLIHVLLITLTAALLTFGSAVAGSIAISGAIKSLQKAAWRKMMRVGIDYYDTHDPSQQVSLLTNDAESVGGGIIAVLTYIPTMLTTIGMSLLMLFSYNVKLLAILLLIIPMNIIYLVFVGRWQARVGQKTVIRTGQLTGYLAERIRNLMMIKVFTAEDKERKNGQVTMNEIYKVRKESTVLSVVITGFATASTVISTVATVIWGCYLLRTGDITQDQFIAFSMYVPVMNLSFSMISIVWTFFKGFVGGSYRLAILFSAEDEMPDSEGISADTVSGDIAFNALSFSYTNAASPTLKDMSFTIPEKKVTAVVGPSGSGKSTVIKLIEQLYRPSSGSLTVGGTDLNSIGTDSWRHKIAYVAQDSGLFSGSIRSAVCYGLKREISTQEMDAVMEKVGLTEFIRSLPDGYETKLENWGSSLSGGQRQRIAIARALLKNADIFIFDEPTSALDPDTANSISDLIFRRFANKTVVIISHELGYIAAADHIVVIRDGSMEGEGTHEELMKQCTVYRDLVEEQSYQEVFA